MYKNEEKVKLAEMLSKLIEILAGEQFYGSSWPTAELICHEQIMHYNFYSSRTIQMQNVNNLVPFS